MADVKKEIKFNKSMTSDKRDEKFAFLRRNLLPTKVDGMYPARDFTDIQVVFPAGYEIADIVGSDKRMGGSQCQIKAVLIKGGSPIIFRNLYGSGDQNNDMPAGITYRASAFGTDGVYVQGSDKNIYRINHENANVGVVGALNGNPVSGGSGTFDGLNYYWVNNNGIWKQPPGGAGTQIMTTIGVSPLKTAFLNDQMIIAYQSGGDIGILFWDKASTTVFDKRIIVKNSTYLGMGVVGGTLILVRSVGNTANAKEYEGEIVIAGFDGEKFETLNTIRAGRRDVSTGNNYPGQNCAVGSEIMLFSVSNNIRIGANTDLGNNYIYKVRKDGSIEVQTLPKLTGTYNIARVVRIFYDFTLYTTINNGGVEERVFSNRDTNYQFSNYANYNETEYITPFLCNSYNYHKLDGISFTFEKMFKNTDSAGDPPWVYPTELTVKDLLFTTLTLTWTKAQDQNTEQNLLEYSIYKSTLNNMTNINDTIANGTKILDWTANIDTYNVTGLTDNTDYYFTVIVRDTAWNMKMYDTKLAHTYTTTLMTSWLNPASNGIVKWSGGDFGVYTNPTNAYLENGIFAVADNNPQKYHAFYNFGSLVPGGSTIVGIQVRYVGKSNYDNSNLYVSLNKDCGSSGGKTDIDLNIGTSTAIPSLVNKSYILGTPIYMWSGSFTAAEINASTFGLVINGGTSGGSPSYTYYVDNLQVRIFYTI